MGHDAVSTPLRSHLATAGQEFADNAAAMRALTDDVRALHDQVLAGGGPHYVERHRARGKMMVRERLEALVDPGTPVLELCPLAGLHTGDPVGGGVVVALTEVAHTQCLVIANDPTVRGGTTSPTTIRKLLRAMDVAEENRLPRRDPRGVRRGRPATPGRRLRARGRAIPPSHPALRAGHPDRLRRLRLLHRRRRVRARHERLHGDGGGPGPGVPGRPAAGEDGHRRGRGRGGAGRGPDARPHLGPVRLPGPRRARGPAHRPAASWPTCTGAGSGPTRPRPADEPLAPGRGAARHRLGGRPGALRRARDPGPGRRRLPLRGVQGVLRGAAGLRLGVDRADIRSAWSPTTGSCSPPRRRRAPSSSAVQPHRHPHPVRAEHHRLHGGHALRAGRHHQGRQPS